MMPRNLLPLAATLVLLTAVPSASAQSAAPGGPRLELARAGFSTAPVAQVAPTEVPAAVLQPAMMRRRGVPQMVIGGVAIIGGAIVGDDVGTIVSLAGLGYGIYGLYLYLN
jgi:hypothetical protein